MFHVKHPKARADREHGKDRPGTRAEHHDPAKRPTDALRPSDTVAHVMETADDSLLTVLSHSQHRGFLGTGELVTHIEHARAHEAAAQPVSGQRWCDLGSGGGVPGLVIALGRPDVEFVLLDRSQRRADFLETAVQELKLADRVTVAFGDAAELARLPEHRHAYDGVVSRAFGPPAAVAECSAGLLCPGGRLVVSEPPGSNETRWPTEPLARLGMRFVRMTSLPPTFAELERLAATDSAYPRRWKQIRKRPLF